MEPKLKMGSQLWTTHSTFYYWGTDLNCFTRSFLLLPDCLLDNRSVLLHFYKLVLGCSCLLFPAHPDTLSAASYHQIFFSFPLPVLRSLPNSPPVFSSFCHHSQKMLVMSESRLKIQMTSGVEIRTNDQDTPLSTWHSLITVALTNPQAALILFGSSSSSSDLLNNKGKKD